MPNKSSLTHDDLRRKALSVLRRSHGVYKSGNWVSQVGFACSVILSEISSAANDCPDAIGWMYGHSVMIECKTSRGDFHADKKKPQRKQGTGAGEQRYFMVPKGLIKKSEVPEGWGLLEVDGATMAEVVHAERRELDLRGHVDEKRLLISTIRRIRTREFLIIQDERAYERSTLSVDDGK